MESLIGSWCPADGNSLRYAAVLTDAQIQDARRRAAQILEEAGFVLTDVERDNIEVADFGLSELEQTGLEVVVYVNTERVCAKEIVMFPGQTCPEHRHPPFDGTPGKEETFRCRKGLVYLYVEGPPAERPACRPAKADRGAYTVWHEVILRPGDQQVVPAQHPALVPGRPGRCDRLGVLHAEPRRSRRLHRPGHRSDHRRRVELGSRLTRGLAAADRSRCGAEESVGGAAADHITSRADGSA